MLMTHHDCTFRILHTEQRDTVSCCPYAGLYFFPVHENWIRDRSRQRLLDRVESVLGSTQHRNHLEPKIRVESVLCTMQFWKYGSLLGTLGVL